MSAPDSAAPNRVPDWAARMPTPCTLGEVVAMTYEVWKANPDAFSNAEGDFAECGGTTDVLSRERLIELIDGLIAEHYRLRQLLQKHGIDSNSTP